MLTLGYYMRVFPRYHSHAGHRPCSDTLTAEEAQLSELNRLYWGRRPRRIRDWPFGGPAVSNLIGVPR